MPEEGLDFTPPDAPINTGGSDMRESTGTAPHIRALAMPFLKGQMITEPDGSLLIRDVPMLAEGVWTDSAQGTPLNYIAKTLEEYAGNWIDTSGWSRHLGGVPRDSTDKVGEAVSPHFGTFTGKDGNSHQAVISDVRIHPFTQKSRDMQEMVRHGLISFVSVEHGGDERFNPATRQMESASLTFMGFAFVNKGACKLCRLNETPAAPTTTTVTTDGTGWYSTGAYPAGYSWVAPSIDAPNEPALPAEDTMETKELEDKIASLTKELEAVKAKPAEVKAEIPKELTEAIGAVKELAMRVEKLEKEPVAPAAAPITVTKELGAVETYVSFNRKDRIARGD